MSRQDRDTIAAIATATGPGAVTILRVSGPSAFTLLALLCPGLGSELLPRQLSLQSVVDPESGESLDEALVVRFPGPASFTGEDVVEIQGHGGAAQADALLGAVLRAGARQDRCVRAARAGEFSRRAYENGRLDLAQAEGVAELIAAGSTAGLRAARGLFGGELSREVQALLTKLSRVQAPVEAAIDFPDQSGEFDEAALMLGLEGLGTRLGRLLSSYAQGRHLREGARVLLLGAPNVGKSSLFNALVGHPRAIVHAAAGTTRDAVEAGRELAGLSLTFVDSAGLREAPGEVEAEGVERTRRAAATADLILWVSDLSSPASAEQEAVAGSLVAALEGETPVLRVGNKVDLLAGDGGLGEGGETLSVSAHTGEGIDRLEAALAAALGAAATEAGGETQVKLTLARHEAAVRASLEALEGGRKILGGGGGLDAVAEELAEARRQLAGILGRIALPEELLEQIFGDFCLGK